MIVIACPGQGSQTPGFLNEWITEADSTVFLHSASEFSGVDLITLGTTASAETIRDTRVAQPLIVAASLLVFKELSRHTTLNKVSVAGHSVGEFAAAAIAGVLSDEQALRLVAVRATAMADAATQTQTGMSAVVGGDEEEVLQAIESHGLTAANRNGSGQIVAAGELPALTALAEDAPKGARVIALQVSGAFHTKFMQSAVDPLHLAAAAITPQDPSLPLYTNATGELITSGSEYLQLLVSQIAQPVRWDLCMQHFQKSQISGFIELTPAGALTGIAKRAMRGVPSVAIKTPSDIAAAVELIENDAA